MFELSLGPCCACRKSRPDVRNVLCIHKLAPVPGTGWGNALLGWPKNGAVAVVCDFCLESNAPLLDAVSGYPDEGVRVPFESLEGEFGNDAPEEFKVTEPDHPDDPSYTMAPEGWDDEDEDHHVPIVLFKLDEQERVIGATEISDDQAAQLFGEPGLTSLSFEQTKKLYGVQDERCACVHTDARECYARRYHVGIDDDDRGECVCSCHDMEPGDDNDHW